MIFTKNQIEGFLEIIDFHTSMFITTQMGGNVLSSADQAILRKFGFDISKIVQAYPPYLQSFMWGNLTGWLDNQQASQVTYNDFNKYLKSGDYIPLSKTEQNMYDLSLKRSYSHVKNLGNVRKDELIKQITEEDIRKEISGSINKRQSAQSIISNWGHKTDNWQRDYGRIVDTEMNSIFQLGRAMSIEKKFGKDTMVMKDVYSGACRYCIRLYLKGGIGSEPKLFTLEQLVANGTNIGRKVADWLPVVESTHPFCRCTINYILEGMVWNDDKKMFTYPEKYERVIQRKSKIKITVGDKSFEI